MLWTSLNYNLRWRAERSASMTLLQCQLFVLNSVESTTIARFSTCKTKLQNKQYRFLSSTGWEPWHLIKHCSDPSHNTWLKNSLSHTHVSCKSMVLHWVIKNFFMRKINNQ